MRALYISHTGMSEPLGQSQVLPYVRGLSRDHGWTFDLVAFEPTDAPEEQVRALADELRRDGISYTWTRRSPSHSAAAKGVEAAAALARLVRQAWTQRPRVIHTRSYLPAAIGLALARVTPGARLLFDCRGLLGDEYVDAGYWPLQSRQYELVKRIEATLFARADAVVTLTERLHRWLVETARLLPASTPVAVIPCCVDMKKFRADPEARRAIRASINAGDRFVVVYSGSLGSWYREADMARVFASVRQRGPALFLVLTRSPVEELLAQLNRLGVSAEDVHVRAIKPADMPAYLSAGDAGLSLISSCFSKMASSPTKIAEYLAVGLPVAMNTDIGDGKQLVGVSDAIVDVGSLTSDDCARTAEQLERAALAPGVAARARQLAEERFSIDGVGVETYARLYERLLA